jgi:hypothetical protein
MSAYHALEWLVVSATVIACAVAAWRRFAPRRAAPAKACDGCASTDGCTARATPPALGK